MGDLGQNADWIYAVRWYLQHCIFAPATGKIDKISRSVLYCPCGNTAFLVWFFWSLNHNTENVFPSFCVFICRLHRKKSGLVCGRSLWYNLLIEIGIPVRSHQISQLFLVIIFVGMHTKDSFCAHMSFSCNICPKGGCLEQRYEQG